MILERTEEQKRAVKRDLFGVSDTYRSETIAYLGDNSDESQRLEYYWEKGKLLITNPVCFNMGLVPEIASFQQLNPIFREKERAISLKYVVMLIDVESYLENSLSLMTLKPKTFNPVQALHISHNL